VKSKGLGGEWPRGRRGELTINAEASGGKKWRRGCAVIDKKYSRGKRGMCPLVHLPHPTISSNEFENQRENLKEGRKGAGNPSQQANAGNGFKG